jgi:anthranilate/para-aminobenzoate synthase component I
MKPFVFDIKTTAGEAFAALQTQPYSLWLDSADTAHTQGRYSYIVSHPVEMIEAKDGRVTVTNSAQQTVLRCDPFDILNERLAAWKSEAETVEGCRRSRAASPDFSATTSRARLKTSPLPRASIRTCRIWRSGFTTASSPSTTRRTRHG